MGAVEHLVHQRHQSGHMNVQRLLAALTVIALSTAVPVSSQVPNQALLTPALDAEKFAIVSAAGQHGFAWRWRAADGTHVIRESVMLRGRQWEQEMTVHVGANGQPDRITSRGTVPSGDAAESFSVTNGRAIWKTQIDSGNVPYDGVSHYAIAGFKWAAPQFELFYRAPNREVALLPSGKARMSKLVDVAVGSGPTAKTITSWAVDGFDLEPILVLLDENGRFFGWADTMALLPVAYAGDHLKIQKTQIEALTAKQPAIARRFGKVSEVPVAFVNVRVYDSEATRFIEDQTVIVQAGRIKAVGRRASVPVPPNARVIDGKGHTLAPGLWDAHMHAGSDSQGARLLSLGETSSRDPGADVQQAVLRRGRIARGELLYPSLYSSVLIDGKGPLTAQSGVSVGSEVEALEAVRAAKRDGFVGVKFYGSFDRRWLPAAAAEAGRLGMHVHGHLPAGMRPREAIAAGYREITHINFVLMEAMPQDVVDASNTAARFHGPGRYAKDVDLDKEPMASLIKEMAARKIAVDPTLVVFESLLATEKGELAPAYVPFIGTVPPTLDRDFKSGGDAPAPGMSRADYRASFRKMMELTRRLYEAGVPILAGTDGGGPEIVRELELYVEAGLTPAQALRTATLNPARLVGADKETGSVSVGKRADLVLVEGDASRDIGAMRQTRWVMQGGALMNADDLREVAGFSGRPRQTATVNALSR